MKSIWLERVIDSVADMGRKLLRLRGNNTSSSSIQKLCLALLAERRTNWNFSNRFTGDAPNRR